MESYPSRQSKGTIWAFITWQANPWFNSKNPIKMSCWYLYEDTAVRCMTTMCMWRTNIGSFRIISIYIGHSAGIAGIIKDLWNMKSILVTNLFWVTWSPSVSRWRVSFCFTVKSYTLLYTNDNLKFNSNIFRSICTSNWKIKNQIKKTVSTQRYIWVTCLQQLRGPTLPVNKRVFFYLGWCFLVAWIHSCGFAKRSPVVSMKFQLSEC